MYPPWVTWVTRLLALAGLGVAVYLSIAHFDARVQLLCPNTSAINCEEVTTSPESVFLGMPVALLGLGYYLAQTALAFWPRPERFSRFEALRLLVSLGGVAFVLYLVYAEIVQIGAICLWCTSVHIVTVALFLVLIYAWFSYRQPARRSGTPSRQLD